MVRTLKPLHCGGSGVMDIYTFFTDIMGSCTVTFNSGCVTCAFLYRNPIGRMKRSYLTGRRVKSGPTREWQVSTSCGHWCKGWGGIGSIPNVGFVIILFHPFFAVFLPVLTTLNISSSLIPFTFGSGTLNFAACEVYQLLRISPSMQRHVPPSHSSYS